MASTTTTSENLKSSLTPSATTIASLPSSTTVPKTPERLSVSGDLLQASTQIHSTPGQALLFSPTPYQASPQIHTSPYQALLYTPIPSSGSSPATSISSRGSPWISQISDQCEAESAPSGSEASTSACISLVSPFFKPTVAFDRSGKQQDTKSSCLQCRLAGLRCSFQSKNVKGVGASRVCTEDETPTIQTVCTRCLRNDQEACIVEDLSLRDIRIELSSASTDQPRLATGGAIDKPRYTAAGHCAVMESLTYEGFGSAYGLGGPSVVRNIRYSDRGGWRTRNKVLVEALRAEREARKEIEELRHRRAQEVAEALLAVEAEREATRRMAWPHTAGRARRSDG